MNMKNVLCGGILFFFLLVLPACAVMPPDHYARMAENSKIKATASVESVKVLETGKHCSLKKVIFRLRHSFSDNISEVFSGTCYSVDHDWQQPLAGGTLYFYPEKGDLVFVTVAGDGGTITSWTYLNDVMEELFIDNKDKIRYGMGNAWLDL